MLHICVILLIPNYSIILVTMMSFCVYVYLKLLLLYKQEIVAHPFKANEYVQI